MAALTQNEATSTIVCTTAGPLMIASARAEGDFVVRVDSGHVDAGDTFEVRITFAPRQDGEQDGTLFIDIETVRGRESIEFPIVGRAGTRSRWQPMIDRTGCAMRQGPALDEAFEPVGLSRAMLSIGEDDLAESRAFRSGSLDDGFTLDRYLQLRNDPLTAGCIERDVASGLETSNTAALIRHAAVLVDESADTRPPLSEAPGDFDDALFALCNGACDQQTGDIPDDLRDALAPLLWSLTDGIAARQRRDASAPHGAGWWRDNGGHGLLLSAGGQGFNPSDKSERAYLSKGRAQLYGAAAHIAHAVHMIDWTDFVGRSGVRFDAKTPAGWVRIRDAADHRHDDLQPVLLFIDLGGDDTYAGPVATNIAGDNPVSIAIDVAGNDGYLAPSEDRRFAGDGRFGRISISDDYRQGAARNGIAMLFDMSGDDTYDAHRASQGYAHQGVGVLFDGSGNDRYTSEAASQGAAQFGIALAIDAGEGNDVRNAYTLSQGFGYVAGAGLLIDAGGDDTYHCDNGSPDLGGTPLYAAPQRPDRSNSSLCQGAGFGLRDEDPAIALSGGIGVLRDAAGNDIYEASVFGQGVGYWQGLGILSDGEGDDRYDGLYYVQGVGVHFAGGILADGGEGNDLFNAVLPAQTLSMGAAHDFSVGVLINEAGDDVYKIRSFSAGGTSCNSVGIFVDNAGSDLYDSVNIHSTGVGNLGECAERRPNAPSIGIAIDAGGNDRYEYPTTGGPRPGEGQAWGHAYNGLPSEYGSGLDTRLDTGLHVLPTAR